MTHRQFPVLYVDDEGANRTTFQYCFDDRFDVLTAASGPDALEILGKRPVAVLVADQRMPGMSGADLCARARAAHPDTVRIAVTAYADLDLALASINLGQVSRYILKPWDEAEMGAALATAIDSYQLASMISSLNAVLPLSAQDAAALTALRAMLHELSGPLTSAQIPLLWLTEKLETLVAGLAAGSTGQHELALEIQKAAGEALESLRETTRRVKGYRSAVNDRRRSAATGATSAAPAPPSGSARAVVESTASMMRREVSEYARLVLDLESIGPVGMANERLSQVVMNLVANARDATPPGRAAEHQITVRLRGGADAATLEVSDTGNGIDPDLLPRIFDVNFTTKELRDGSRGLGLAVVRDLVKASGGEVTVRSAVGHGATFTVTLPLATVTRALDSTPGS